MADIAAQIPHNLDTERAVLGAVLVDQKKADELFLQCTAKDFYHRNHRVIFGALKVLYEKDGSLDLVSVTDKLKDLAALEEAGGAAYVSSLVDGMPRAFRLDYHIEKLREKRQRRELIQAGEIIKQQAFDMGSENVVEEAQVALSRIADTSRKDFFGIEELLDQVVKKAEQIQKSGGMLIGPPTGLLCFDKLVGGIPPSSLTIVAARPSVGKSSFCMNVAVNAALADNKVAIFSIEDTLLSLGQRMLCSLARVDGMNMMRGKLSNAEWGWLKAAEAKLEKLKIYSDDTPPTITDLKAKARRIKAKHGLDLIVVDYLQLMIGGDQENRNLQVAEWTRDLKSLAKELDVSLLVASQLSRASEAAGRRPRLSDLRDSGAIEQDADMVILLHDPKVDGFKIFDPRPLEVAIAKNRNGPKGIFDDQILFIPAYTLFIEKEDRACR